MAGLLGLLFCALCHIGAMTAFVMRWLLLWGHSMALPSRSVDSISAPTTSVVVATSGFEALVPPPFGMVDTANVVSTFVPCPLLYHVAANEWE